MTEDNPELPADAVPPPPTGEWIVRGVGEESARSFLRRHEPWRIELKFDSGPKASDGPTFQPFNEATLNKMRILLEHISETVGRGGHVLDIGFNAGYNSLFLAQEFDANVIGIDVSRKHKSVADELAGLLQVRAKFRLASAEDFERPNRFDLILHLGTLYHLANPVLSLQRCFRSLKKGGWFALETICYRGSDDPAACKWIHNFAGDVTNFWALGEGAIQSIAKYCGIAELRMVLEVWPEAYNREMSRTIWVGRRSELA